MNDWIEEHIRTLANISDISLEDARRFFQQDLYITIDPDISNNRTYLLAYSYSVNLLTRLFPTTRFDEIDGAPLLILPWGTSSPLEAGSHPAGTVLVFGKNSSFLNFKKAEKIVTANCHDWHVYIDLPISPDPYEQWNPVLALATACYAASRVTKVLLGNAVQGPEKWHPFSILDFRHGKVNFDWNEPLPIGDVCMAGIGAIGSSTLASFAAHGAATGNLLLLDHDSIERRNLGRYSFFDISDEGKNKTTRAKKRLDGMGLSLTVEAEELRFEEYYNTKQSQDPLFGVPRLLSAPDRRDTRRLFQSKLPRELWDASTGPDQVVFHHNQFDPELACLACVYPEDPIEHAHARHVSETLNVPIERILSSSSIDASDFDCIAERYPHLSKEVVIGRAFDSLFRELCSAGKLLGPDKVVLAPFSFISGIAGVFLYFEFVKSLRSDIFGPYQKYNYTELNPWYPPNPEFKIMKSFRPNCSCQDVKVQNLFAKIWERH